MAFPEAFYRWRPHPWHGLEIGPDTPDIVHAYIELTPFDLVKYELDKKTGYLRVDRPQQTSSQPPTLYGFVPRTWCDRHVAALMPGAKNGDRDPLDICVISERPIARSEVILNARVIGGLPMLDGGEADDKIIAILEKDNVWGGLTEVTELPIAMLDRLRHYFSTYKLSAGETPRVTIGETYGREHAIRVIRAAMADYAEMFGDPT